MAKKVVATLGAKEYVTIKPNHWKFFSNAVVHLAACVNDPKFLLALQEGLAEKEAKKDLKLMPHEIDACIKLASLARRDFDSHHKALMKILGEDRGR